MSTKIYNGLMTNDVKTIKQLSNFQQTLREIQKQGIIDEIYNSFNEFFRNYVYGLIRYKGYVPTDYVFQEIRFLDNVFTGIRETLIDKDDSYETIKNEIEREFNDAKIQKRFENIKQGKNEEFTNFIKNNYNIDITSDDYKSDFLVLYIIILGQFISLKNYYDFRFAKPESNSYMIYLFPLDNEKLLGFSCNDQIFKNIIDSGVMYDYHYQNSSDQPEDISHYEWTMRKKDWDKAIHSSINEGLGIEPDMLDITIKNFRIDNDRFPALYNNFRLNYKYYTTLTEHGLKMFFENDFKITCDAYSGKQPSIRNFLRKFQDYYDNVVTEESKQKIRDVFNESLIDDK
ncbi:hypothetical protein PBI_SCTP2_102 [Salicola phage SCTP-2]|nr:hypothetical protein PBI_SCTP2_102 [Salicola phage SCTP-2]